MILSVLVIIDLVEMTQEMADLGAEVAVLIESLHEDAQKQKRWLLLSWPSKRLDQSLHWLWAVDLAVVVERLDSASLVQADSLVVAEAPRVLLMAEGVEVVQVAPGLMRMEAVVVRTEVQGLWKREVVEVEAVLDQQKEAAEEPKVVLGQTCSPSALSVEVEGAFLQQSSRLRKASISVLEGLSSSGPMDWV